jgi:peptidoglycan/LPS O-acetylase OafA/YrhL
MNSDQPNSRTKIGFPGLDALRGYAAIAVVIFHAAPVVWPGRLMQSGYLAVDLFFVMSGFVVAHAYENKVYDIGTLAFIRLRVIRFAPLFLAGGLVGLIRPIVQILEGQEVTGISIATISYLLFLPSPSTSFSDTLFAPLNPPAWSLMLELYINIIWALCLPYLSTKRLIAITSLGALGCLTVLVGGLSLAAGSHIQDFAVAVARILFSFPLGLLLYRFRHIIPVIKLPNFAIASICLLVFASPQFATLEMAFIFMISPLLVLSAARQTRYTVVSRYGAKSSYCIYMLHMPGTWVVYGVCSKLGASPVAGTIAWIMALLVFAPYIDRWFDQPARTLLMRDPLSFYKRKTVAQATVLNIAH